MPSAPKRGIREDAGAGRHAAEIRNNSAHFTVALAEANHFLEDRLECAKCGDDDPPMLLKERGLLVFGSSASWTMISATSTTRHADSNRSITPSDQKCYRCLRNKP